MILGFQLAFSFARRACSDEALTMAPLFSKTQVRFWEHVFDLAPDALASQAVCRRFDSLRLLQFLSKAAAFWRTVA
jgi:hypothetical protein